jgi:hypothetical protein
MRLIDRLARAAVGAGLLRNSTALLETKGLQERAAARHAHHERPRRRRRAPGELRPQHRGEPVRAGARRRRWRSGTARIVDEDPDAHGVHVEVDPNPCEGEHSDRAG